MAPWQHLLLAVNPAGTVSQLVAMVFKQKQFYFEEDDGFSFLFLQSWS